MSMRSGLALLLTVVGTGCATLDTTRPIEKGSFLSVTRYEQDGRVLEYWSTTEALSQVEASRVSAQRSRNLNYWALGLDAAGVAAVVSSSALNKEPMYWAGVGLVMSSLVPAFMSVAEYGRAVDAYNGTLRSSAPHKPATSYVTPIRGGAAAGVVCSF